MPFDRKIYFDSVRSSLFGSMSQQQVDGQNAIIDQWESQPTDIRWLAYMLATTYHETAKTMWPIEEYGKGKGKSYGVPDPKTGQTYYGRGFVQLTWADNYQKATAKLGLTGDADIYWNAAMALDLDIAGGVMFAGMAEGWFRTKNGQPESLPRYFNDTTDDPVNARGIINGDVSSMGQQVASYHQKFLGALRLAWEDEPLPPEPDYLYDVALDLALNRDVSIGIWLNGEQIVDIRT